MQISATKRDIFLRFWLARRLAKDISRDAALAVRIIAYRMKFISHES
jgi:hypothetical protein